MSTGDFGHLLLVIAFVTACIAAASYFLSAQKNGSIFYDHWIKTANHAFIVHGSSVFAALGVLIYMTYTHQYQYQYIWKHSSNDLAWYYILSCLWEGQEGSFLLWGVWNVVIGFTIIRTTKELTSPVMATFGLIQAGLLSMILGAYITDEWRIGSSPFLLLKETMSDPIFSVDPHFVPQDGNGLNPLLQNIWMVIHPPVIFLGFSMSSVPFAFVIAGLWKRSYQTIVQPTSIWLIATVCILGIGIMMGAYWAYETLNFGGYWNWDPVENAVLIPWLMLMGAIHGLVLYRRKQKGLPLAMILIITGYLLVIYATFLTRSGILGNASVHAFTDLGLSGQLLCFLLCLVLLSIVLMILRKNDLFQTLDDPPAFSIDFWMVLGICVLTLSAFQVLLCTSIPVFNTLMALVGIHKKFAPPADQVVFYSKFQIWFAIAFCLFGGIAQVIYWRKTRSLKELENHIFWPLIATLIATTLIVLVEAISNLTYIFAIFSALYVSFVGVLTLVKIIKGHQNRAMGGLLSHIGLGVMIIGFVFSAGHQKVISQNLTINAPNSDLPPHTVQENLLLSRNVPKENTNTVFTYHQKYHELPNGTRLPADNLLTISATEKIVSTSCTSSSGKVFSAGDTVIINAENTFYALEMTTPKGQKAQLLPRMQNNPTMGYIASPDIQHFLTRDVYTHITNFPDPEKTKWGKPVSFTLNTGESFHFKGLNISLQEVQSKRKVPGIAPRTSDLNIEATLIIADSFQQYTAHPVFHIDKSRKVKLFPDNIPALGIKAVLSKILPDKDEYEITLISSQRDWITIKSIEFPWLSLVWVGFLVMTSGMVCALFYRIAHAHEGLKQVHSDSQTKIIQLRPLNHAIELKKPLNT